MKKQNFILMIAVIMFSLFSIVSVNAETIGSGECGDNLTWSLDDNGTLTISGTGDMEDYANNNSPFLNQNNIKSVVVEDGVTSIGSFAFANCEELTSIKLSDSVTSIGHWSFMCPNLIEIELSKNCTVIEGAALLGCTRLKSITIPEGVISIGYGAFAQCESLEDITIPHSLTSIESWAFEGCTDLTDIYYNGSKMDWAHISIYEDSEGSGNTYLTTAKIHCTDGLYEVPQGLLYKTYDNHIEITGFNGMPFEVEIPSEIDGLPVTKICDSAFANINNSKLKTVTIPDSVTSIGSSAFENCRTLEHINIPNSVAEIGERAFLACDSLSSVELPTLLTEIKYGTFHGCYSLENITIPNGVTSIGRKAFSESGLKNITIPDSVTSIGESAFAGSGIISINIPNSVTSIGDSAFNCCTGLIDITIPNSLTYIGDGAFYLCSNLKEIHITDLASWCSLDLTNTNNPLVYGADLYINNILAEDIIIPESITNIKDCAFKGCSSLKSVAIPNSVVSIGIDAFRNCVNLTSITMQEGISSISSGAFMECVNLDSITIPNSVVNIGSHAFYNCSSLASATIPDSIKNIDEFTFYNCANLAKINLGNGIKNINDNAFDGCNKLTDVYYNNTFAKYQEIYIGNTGNKPFIQATKHYVSDSPIPPDPTEQNSVIINIEPMRGTAGNEITVPIRIKNNPGISSFSLKVSYDITQLVPISIAKNSNLPGSLTSNIEQLGNYTGLEYVTAVWSNASDYSEDGDLFYITFRVYSTIKKGTYIPINISSTGNIVNQEYEEITALLKNGSVIIDFIYGDIYGDGVLDNKDLVRMRQYLADWDITLTEEEKKAADVYADGTINNKDLVRLSQYFAGWNVRLGR